MITVKNGNIFNENVEVIVNPVCSDGNNPYRSLAAKIGVKFPEHENRFQEHCKNCKVEVGKAFIVYQTNGENGESEGKKIVYVTIKEHWNSKTNMNDMDKAIQSLKKIIVEKDIKSIAMTPIGGGKLGLNWEKVREKIAEELGKLDVEIRIIENNRPRHRRTHRPYTHHYRRTR